MTETGPETEVGNVGVRVRNGSELQPEVEVGAGGIELS